MEVELHEILASALNGEACSVALAQETQPSVVTTVHEAGVDVMASRKISVPHGNCTPAVQPEANNFTELSRLSHATKKHGKSNATRKFHGSTATVNIRSYYLSGSFQYLPLFPLFLPTLILRFQIYIPLERRFDPWSPPSAGHNDCLHH